MKNSNLVAMIIFGILAVIFLFVPDPIMAEAWLGLLSVYFGIKK